jgi:hypothetical protein
MVLMHPCSQENGPEKREELKAICSKVFDAGWAEGWQDYALNNDEPY